jgi:hypothetical protein|tara:strand:- start:1145 stop:1690 length:546 start_codon:yes stop_codon:yes gene_type:complete
MAATKATELAQLSRKLTYNEGSNVASITGTGDVLTTANTTDNLNVGSSNLYFTTALARSAVSASGDLAYNSSTGAISYSFATSIAAADSDDLSEGSTNLYFTDARVNTYLTNNTYATQTYVGTQITNLIDSSPGALNTLNELAAALGDDANFSTTITNLINTKTTLAAAIDEATALAIALG